MLQSPGKESQVTGDGESEIGIVAIGRNEYPCLRRCLASLLEEGRTVVYVDSGSTDGSVELAKRLGAEVVELDSAAPFTAGRARNAGFEHLMQLRLSTEFVQFVDGDCEIADGWLRRAATELQRDKNLAIVAGRVREQFPERSVYNRLCDLEWDVPTGEVDACGGIFLARAEAFRKVGEFDPSIIAGEEPELCLRLRRRAWKVVRIDAEMALHDAAMTRFGQWWKRAVRSGHAFAEGAWIHGASPERHGVKAVRSFVFWGAVVPVIAFGGAWITHGASLALLLGYALLWYRVARGQRARGRSDADVRLYAAFILTSKFAELYGALIFVMRKLLRRRSTIIEYKESGRVCEHGSVSGRI